MPSDSPLPTNDPRVVAWESYKATEGFANTKRWAGHPQHVEGSLWTAFVEGWKCARFDPAADRPEARCPRIDLPGVVEQLVVEYANPEGLGPRADDLLIHLYAVDKTFLGTLTLGWFRAHTSVADGEESMRSTGVE